MLLLTKLTDMSASFKFSRKRTLVIVSLISVCKTLTVASEFNTFFNAWIYLLCKWIFQVSVIFQRVKFL